jgi:hypothetical protein
MFSFPLLLQSFLPLPDSPSEPPHLKYVHWSIVFHPRIKITQAMKQKEEEGEPKNRRNERHQEHHNADVLPCERRNLEHSRSFMFSFLLPLGPLFLPLPCSQILNGEKLLPYGTTHIRCAYIYRDLGVAL